MLKEGIERANQKFQEKRDKKINNILSFIALLAIFSVVWDFSEWINKLISGDPVSFRIISGSSTAVIILLMIIFLFRYYRKKS